MTVAPAEQVLTEFGRWPNSWLYGLTWRSIESGHDVAPAEQVLTEFRLTAKHRPLESFVWDRKVDQ